MRDFINKQLVNVVKSHIQPDESLVDVIMNVLSLGKEAAYRRIRGEVPFTLCESVILSKTFRLSLDSIVGVSLPNVAVVNTSFINTTKMYSDYKRTLDTYISLFKEMNNASQSYACMAFNIIPFTFYARHEGLSKFKLYRWMHQMDILPPGMPFSEMNIPDDVWKLHQELIHEIDDFENVCYILDRNIFSTFVNEINHFIQLGLLNADDCLVMKKELVSLLELLEKLVREGGTPQNNVAVYISNIEIDSSYSYYEAEDLIISSFRVFAVNTMNTQDVSFGETQKKWVESLKRYSVLISGCGEMERVKFISKQKEIVNLL